MLRIRIAEDMLWKPAPGFTRDYRIFPDEAGTALSVGTTRDGFMVHGMPYPFPSTEARQLPVQYERGILYGTANLMLLLQNTASAMQKKYPDTWMYLGNMGAREGGDIPWSISHNAGRDADIGYYLKDESGNFAQPENMYKITRKLVSRDSPVVYSFDVEKNATLVETLIMHETVAVQFLFVAKHLRKALRAELERRERPQEVLDRFDACVQDQAAHDDHFHVRIYCSDEDICAGCMDRSTIHPWQRDPEPVRAQCVARFRKMLENDATDDETRATALLRLALLHVASQNADLIVKHLAAPSVTVRAAAAKAARSLGNKAADAIDARMQVETDPDVRLSLFEAMATLDSASTRTAFIRELGNEAIDARSLGVITRYVTRHPHEAYWKPLFAALQRNPQDGEILDALRTVANRNFCNGRETSEKCLEKLDKWHRKNAGKKRTVWLTEGFAAEGFPVHSLDAKSIIPLLDAIDGPRALSINAQLTLRDIAKLEQNSLDWPVEDARWHYTRFFKKNARKFHVDLSDRDEKGIKLATPAPPAKRRR